MKRVGYLISSVVLGGLSSLAKSDGDGRSNAPTVPPLPVLTVYAATSAVNGIKLVTESGYYYAGNDGASLWYHSFGGAPAADARLVYIPGAFDNSTSLGSPFSDSPSNFRNFAESGNGQVFFSYNDLGSTSCFLNSGTPNYKNNCIGRQLYVTDGTSKGTHLTKNLTPVPMIYPAALSGAPTDQVWGPVDSIYDLDLFHSNAVVSGNHIYYNCLQQQNFTSAMLAKRAALFSFNATAAMKYGTDGYELCVSDGTASGTYEVGDANPTTVTFGAYQNAVVLAGDAYNYDYAPTPQGITSAASVGASGLPAYQQGALNEPIPASSYSYELTGSSNGYSKMSRPQEMTVTKDGRVFFSAYNPTYGLELWVTGGHGDDGHGGAAVRLTSDANATLASVNQYFYNNFDAGQPGQTAASTASSSPFNLKAVGNKVFFAGYSVQNTADAYVSDGTPTGTVKLTSSSIYDPSNFGQYNYPDGQSYYNVSGPSDFTGVRNGTVFAFNDGSDLTVGGRGQLWVTDGTQAGTRLLKDFSRDMPGDPVYFPYYSTGYEGIWDAQDFSTMVSVDGGSTAVFDAVEGVPGAVGYGHQVWVTDGSTKGTMPISTVNSAYAALFTRAGNRVYWMDVGGPSQPAMLHQTDGTPEGTSAIDLSSVCPGLSYNQGNSNAISAPPSLYVSGNDIMVPCSGSGSETLVRVHLAPADADDDVPTPSYAQLNQVDANTCATLSKLILDQTQPAYVSGGISVTLDPNTLECAYTGQVQSSNYCSAFGQAEGFGFVMWYSNFDWSQISVLYNYNTGGTSCTGPNDYVVGSVKESQPLAGAFLEYGDDIAITTNALTVMIRPKADFAAAGLSFSADGVNAYDYIDTVMTSPYYPASTSPFLGFVKTVAPAAIPPHFDQLTSDDLLCRTMSAMATDHTSSYYVPGVLSLTPVFSPGYPAGFSGPSTCTATTQPYAYTLCDLLASQNGISPDTYLAAGFSWASVNAACQGPFSMAPTGNTYTVQEPINPPVLGADDFITITGQWYGDTVLRRPKDDFASRGYLLSLDGVTAYDYLDTQLTQSGQTSPQLAFVELAAPEYVPSGHFSPIANDPSVCAAIRRLATDSTSSTHLPYVVSVDWNSAAKQCIVTMNPNDWMPCWETALYQNGWDWNDTWMPSYNLSQYAPTCHGPYDWANYNWSPGGLQMLSLPITSANLLAGDDIVISAIDQESGAYSKEAVVRRSKADFAAAGLILSGDGESKYDYANISLQNGSYDSSPDLSYATMGRQEEVDAAFSPIATNDKVCQALSSLMLDKTSPTYLPWALAVGENWWLGYHCTVTWQPYGYDQCGMLEFWQTGNWDTSWNPTSNINWAAVTDGQGQAGACTGPYDWAPNGNTTAFYDEIDHAVLGFFNDIQLFTPGSWSVGIISRQQAQAAGLSFSADGQTAYDLGTIFPGFTYTSPALLYAEAVPPVTNPISSHFTSLSGMSQAACSAMAALAMDKSAVDAWGNNEHFPWITGVAFDSKHKDCVATIYNWSAGETCEQKAIDQGVSDWSLITPAGFCPGAYDWVPGAGQTPITDIIDKAVLNWYGNFDIWTTTWQHVTWRPEPVWTAAGFVYSADGKKPYFTPDTNVWNWWDSFENSDDTSAPLTFYDYIVAGGDHPPSPGVHRHDGGGTDRGQDHDKASDPRHHN